MRMEKRTFRIGELADHLQIKRFVIRFWEKEFSIKPKRSSGGQRYYDETDLQTFQTIKQLLYEKKFTIAGAKRLIKNNSDKRTIDSVMASHITTIDSTDDAEKNTPLSPAKADLLLLRDKLLKLKELL